MDLKEYFSTTLGTGVISTADSDGKVNSAIFSRPHVYDDGTVAFLMRERLIRHHLQSNPYASFLFIEKTPGHKGIRLHLKKIREEYDAEIIDKMRQRKASSKKSPPKEPIHLIRFSIEKILPLLGNGKLPVSIK